MYFYEFYDCNREINSLFYYFSQMVGDRQVTTTTTFECCAGYENSFKGTCEKVSNKITWHNGTYIFII